MSANTVTTVVYRIFSYQVKHLTTISSEAQAVAHHSSDRQKSASGEINIPLIYLLSSAAWIKIIYLLFILTIAFKVDMLSDIWPSEIRT